MALLSFSRSFTLLFSPCHFFSPRSIRRRRSFVCSLSAATDVRSRSAVLWFKHDLRLNDHPALSAAETHRFVLPLYVFDRRILSRMSLIHSCCYSDDMLELLLFALEDLRNSLKEQGSNLMIRYGCAENVIKELVKEVSFSYIFSFVEYEMRQLIGVVKKTLETSSSLDWNLDIVMWRTPFYDVKNLKELPASYNDFKKQKLLPTSPLLPATLPVAETELDWGPLPNFSDLKEFIKEKLGKSKESWNLMKEMPAEVLLKENLSKSSETIPKSLNDKSIEQRRLDKSVFVTRKGDIVGGGTNTLLNALAAYLRYLEGTARDDWQEVHERLRNAETREGASFTSLFGPALCLGIISRRRVHYEAIKYEKERNAGFLSPFGYSAASVAAAADAVCSMEWFWLLALKSQVSNEGLYTIRIWRWRGHLIQYTVVGLEGPAILLVHGFGAFLEHYRDNINAIAEHGNHVWGITLLGFGQSEKPNVVYTELLWAEMLRDFIIEVVGEPVHLVGNSIGGYFVSIVACLWPTLVKSVILMNTAGNVIPEFSSRWFPSERQTSAAARLGAQLLLFYLRLNIKNTLKKFYPTKTNRADDWLINEMLRAVSSLLFEFSRPCTHTIIISSPSEKMNLTNLKSYDPGVTVVLESIFSFDLSIPLNYLLEGYEEKVLILQGMKDPLLDSKAKLAMLKEHCTGLAIRELDAGHCPHDEQPQKVNSIVCEWVVAVERKLTANSYS
ncbi:(6-4)DNA photolyase [Gossypium australe]|uniref:(6-4)DNA photolyase n=1 Tax=Gossypium australe TaxID=47621 RepID=A0A5B6US30_9ROSI|nr:(6-4)DNA photolyase [Gossypium australe]